MTKAILTLLTRDGAPTDVTLSSEGSPLHSSVTNLENNISLRAVRALWLHFLVNPTFALDGALDIFYLNYSYAFSLFMLFFIAYPQNASSIIVNLVQYNLNSS